MQENDKWHPWFNELRKNGKVLDLIYSEGEDDYYKELETITASGIDKIQIA